MLDFTLPRRRCTPETPRVQRVSRPRSGRGVTPGVRVKLFFLIRLAPSFLKIQTQPARPRKGQLLLCSCDLVSVVSCDSGAENNLTLTPGALGSDPWCSAWCSGAVLCWKKY